MVVVLFVGWLRETESSCSDAERVYSDCAVDESKQMTSLPASRSSLASSQGQLLRNDLDNEMQGLTHQLS